MSACACMGVCVRVRMRVRLTVTTIIKAVLFAFVISNLKR